jgi:hypothetical protein
MGAKVLHLSSSTEEIPVISNAKVSNISTTGYTVTCTVTKDANLNRVEFPTWTTKNGQDDLPSKWPEGTRSGNNYTFRVNIADHNYEDGEYITHIYAWTNGGKKAAISLPSVTISKKHDKPEENLITLDQIISSDTKPIRENVKPKSDRTMKPPISSAA